MARKMQPAACSTQLCGQGQDGTSHSAAITYTPQLVPALRERDQQCLGKSHSSHLQSPSVVQVSPPVTQLPHPQVFLACLGKTFLVFPHIRISPVASCSQPGWGFFLPHFPPQSILWASTYLGVGWGPQGGRGSRW